MLRILRFPAESRKPAIRICPADEVSEMDAYTLSAHAISEKARAERLYLHYALALASLFAISGAILAVLALGDRLDVVAKGDGGLDARLLNAAPGFALCLAAALLIIVSRPRRMPAPSTPAPGVDDIEQRIERAVLARMGGRYTATGPGAGGGNAPASMLSSIAGNLADALEQSALEALVALRQGREAEPPPEGARKPGAPVSADT
jgi:hypothetical protein